MTTQTPFKAHISVRDTNTQIDLGTHTSAESLVISILKSDPHKDFRLYLDPTEPFSSPEVLSNLIQLIATINLYSWKIVSQSPTRIILDLIVNPFIGQVEPPTYGKEEDALFSKIQNLSLTFLSPEDCPLTPVFQAYLDNLVSHFNNIDLVLIIFYEALNLYYLSRFDLFVLDIHYTLPNHPDEIRLEHNITRAVLSKFRHNTSVTIDFPDTDQVSIRINFTGVKNV